jgi:xylulokinase
MFGEAVGRLPGTGAILGAGSVDGLCEQLVAGAVEDGDVLVALGSTLVVWLCVPGWPSEVPGLWRVPHFVAGKAMVGGASNAGGIWVDWVDRLIRPAGDATGGAARTGAAHSSTRPDAGERPGEVPLWWPWARGERVPWHDRSLRIGMGSADISHGPATLRRAALEASSFVARYILERASHCGTAPRRVIVSGGGTANPAWVQALADVLGRPVLPVVVPETAALGAAFLARVASGAEASVDGGVRWARWQAPVEPRRDWAAAASARYEQWCQALPSAPG